MNASRRRRQAVDGQAAVYTIPPDLPFVDALAAGVLARLGGRGGIAGAASGAARGKRAGVRDPLALTRSTIRLPTRRACRSLREAFLRQSGGRPMLLPRMIPLGDIDADELVLSGGAETGFTGGFDLPPAISGLRRQLLLTRFVLELGRESWAEPPGADQAARLAAELARLLDQVQTERLSFDRLAGLAPEDYASHWQETLEFLRILTEHWPDILAEEGCIDPARRRNLVLEAQAEAWRRDPPADPVIAAGSTGSIPATADLLKVVACLPAGCVILPGLDVAMPDEGWQKLGQSHPQFGLARLLEHIGVARDAVKEWDAPGLESTRLARAALINEALRPAAVTHGSGGIGPWPGEAFAGVARLDCRGPQEEAGAIALMMRQALEREGESAALVTPDRGLARRVAAELERWGIAVDDSAGKPLAATPVGAFLRLVAAMVAQRAAPLALLAALKHPLAAGGMKEGAFRANVRELERAILRGPRPAPGFEGVTAALEARARDGGKTGKRCRGLIRWLAPIAGAVGPLAAALAHRAVPFTEILRSHVAFAEALAESDAASGGERLWAGEDGEAMADFIAELYRAGRGFPPIGGARYPALFDALLAGRVVRPSHGLHARLHIWGTLEARLQHADLMVLGGLNEGTWPPEAETDPWMSRPMREKFGLPLPERRIGLSAHDFAQAFSAPKVVMTRATRVEGTPTVPSRWLLRLDNVLAAAGMENALMTPEPWLDWQQSLDRPGKFAHPERPMPRPPVAARPRRLSVTEVETWMRDPYAIYARHVLGLRRLDAIDADPGAAERGTFIHECLDRFLREWPDELPEDACERLLEIGREVFAPALSRPGVWAFWWPRFERVARWFADAERRRRARARPLASERRGKLVLDGPGGPFTLLAAADRIDRLEEGGGRGRAALAIIDYKTGSPPSQTDLERGFAPQLPLEAAIAARGGFEDIPALPVGELGYWHLSGGEPAGKETAVRGDPAELARAALEGLERLIASFDDPATPYLARPRPDKALRYGDYDHLARVKEWSSAAEDGGGDGS